MDSSDDNELLKQIPEENSKEDTASQLDSSLDNIYVVKRAKYSDENIEWAPIHALQTAFTSLQKKLNEEIKKSKTLSRENQSLKKALMDATQGNQPHYENLDREEYMFDTQNAHAAVGTNEEESLAENRAKQGHVHHLQRELLIATNAIHLGNDEILKLKSSNEAYEMEMKKLGRKSEELLSENVELKDRLRDMDDEISRRNLEIAQMKNALQSEQEQNHNMKLKLESSQEQINQLQTTGYTGQNEIQNLKLRVMQLENELRKSYSATQFRELESKLKETEESRGILEAKCKQLEIECDIRSEQRQQEDCDDIDGDVAALKKALDILHTEKEEVRELKKKLEDQHSIILQLQSTGKRYQGKSLDMSMIRPEAQGSSFHLFPDAYENHSDFHPNIEVGHSPLSRRKSDRGDYRTHNSNQEQKTSPRVEDKIRPVGQLTPMLAMESNMLPKRMESVGNFVASNISPNKNRSPAENIGDSKLCNTVGMRGHKNMFSKSSVAGIHPTIARSSASPRTGNEHEPFGSVNVSYGNVSNNQAVLQSNLKDTTYAHAGARPRVPVTSTEIGYFSHFDSEEIASPIIKPQQKIPDRMTQSEIISKNRPGPDKNLMTRSICDPIKPIEINQSPNNNKQNDFMHSETSGIGQNLPQISSNEHTYQNDYREHYDNGPDYENIYNANAQTETKRPIEEHEDPVYTTANERGFNIITNPVQEEIGNVNVATVKICPVCNEECSRLTLNQFQMHVVECFDNNDESPATLQPTPNTKPLEEDRTCPMCDAVFPLTIPQETYEQHVLAHFGDDPHIERFEMLQ